MADRTTIAFIRVHIDRHDPADIARDLGCSASELEALVALEYGRRQRDHTLPPHLRDAYVPPQHVVIATEDRVCGDHGPYLAQRWGTQPMLRSAAPFWGNCPQCNRLWQHDVDTAAEAARSGIPQKQRAALARLEAAEVPPRYHHCGFPNFEHGMPGQRDAWNILRDYAFAAADVIATGRCLMLVGSTGCGKTHLAVAVLRHFVEKGATACYTTLADLLIRVRASYGHAAAETETQALNHFTSPDLLVVDEIGADTDSAHAIAKLILVLNTRYGDLKPCILISNLGKEQIRTLLTEPIYDRMREAGGRIVTFAWGSYRGKRPTP